jgi:hypothetical protein
VVFLFTQAKRRNPMRKFSLLLGLSLLAAASVDARAAEYALGTYGLGGNAFGAGVTPPAGTYVTTAYSYYTATIGTTVNFDTVTLNAGARIQAFTSALNLLYVPERKLFGGNLGLSVTIPVSHVDYLAGIGIGSFAATQEVAGWGLGDIVPRAELGWQHGEFAHLVYLQVVTPTASGSMGSPRLPASIGRGSTPAGPSPGRISRRSSS